jgi:hypothetical protein
MVLKGFLESQGYTIHHGKGPNYKNDRRGIGETSSPIVGIEVGECKYIQKAGFKWKEWNGLRMDLLALLNLTHP